MPQVRRANVILLIDSTLALGKVTLAQRTGSAMIQRGGPILVQCAVSLLVQFIELYHQCLKTLLIQGTKTQLFNSLYQWRSQGLNQVDT